MILNQIIDIKKKGQKQVALLIDPGKTCPEDLQSSILFALTSFIDYFFIGGSFGTNDNLNECIRVIRAHCKLPIVLFPGHENQLTPEADAILLLSLISGRNADLLIGKHVQAAHALKKSKLEIIPTGYMLVDSGRMTSVNYISNTLPLPADKHELAAATAIAGELLGMQLLYLDAGSGAQNPVAQELIRAVVRQVNIPLIVGGGIRDASSALAASSAGADILVVGTSFEEDPASVINISKAFKKTKDGTHSRIQL